MTICRMYGPPTLIYPTICRDIHRQAMKASKDVEFNLADTIHASEYRTNSTSEAVHKFEVNIALHEPVIKVSWEHNQVTLEPSSFTPEKFALYQKYQREVHKEETEKSSASFKSASRPFLLL